MAYIDRSRPKEGLLPYSLKYSHFLGNCNCELASKFSCLFLSVPALLQGLTLIFGTQTGCRRLDSYIEQKKFLACGPGFSVEFSAPPEFCGGVTEKCLCTGWARTFDLQITKQILYHCATTPCVCKVITCMCCLPGFSGRF